jgi:acetyl esterase/lipase
MPSPATSPSSPPHRPDRDAATSPSSPDLGPDRAVGRVADLQLRGRTGPVPARVLWPEPSTRGDRRALLVFFPAGDATGGGLDQAEPLCRELCARAGVVVLSVSYRPDRPDRPGTAFEDAVTATRWSADHATELGADARRLVVGGEGAGAGLAAAVALHARDEGWPPITRQLLIRPRLDVELPGGLDGATTDGLGAPPLHATSVAGVAPATVVTVESDPGREGARRYAARLRQAGVPVDERHLDGTRADPTTTTVEQHLGGTGTDPAMAGDERRRDGAGADVVPPVAADLAEAVCRSLEEAGHD